MGNESTSFCRVTAEFLEKIQTLDNFKQSEIERLNKENEILKKCVECYAKGEIEKARSYLINNAIDKKDEEIERLKKSLKELIFHCEDYGIKEESLAVLMAVETARQALGEIK